MSINVASNRSSYNETHKTRYEQTMNLFFLYLESPKPLRILDLETGTGHVAISVKNSFPQREIVARDVSIWENSLKKLKDARA